MADDESISDDARLWMDEEPRAQCYYWRPTETDSRIITAFPFKEVITPAHVNSGRFNIDLWRSLKLEGMLRAGRGDAGDPEGLRHLNTTR
jgi:hypothetical protein